MSDTATNDVPPYEAMSFYALGVEREQRSRMRRSAFEMQQLCRTIGVPSYVADNMIAVSRNIGFARDHAFVEAFGNACRQPEDMHKLWRLHTYCWALGTALRLPGDLVECGVFEGLYAATALAYLGDGILQGRRYYLYDTFHGLDERYASDTEMWLSGSSFSAPGLEAQVRERFAGWPDVKVIAGTVPDVLDTESPASVAFLHLDLNCHSAELAALARLYDRIPDGGVILLDDYGRSEFEPMYNAYQAWAREAGQRILEMPTGQGLIIKSGR